MPAEEHRAVGDREETCFRSSDALVEACGVGVTYSADATAANFPGALRRHAARLRHTAAYVRQTGRRQHLISLHYWVGTELWMQTVSFERDGGDVVFRPEQPVRRESAADASFLATVLDHTDDVVLVTESEPQSRPGPRVLYANAAFQRLTGYALSEIVGRTPRILQGPDSEKDVIERMGRALRSWQPTRIEITNYHRDGKPFVVEIGLHPVADETGWYTHWVSVQRDVTARRAAEADTLRSDRAHTMSLLAGGIAHDFNNLLVSLMGNLELARLSHDDPAEVDQLLQDAEAAAQQARALTRQLMHFSRDAQPSVASIDLGELLSETLRFALRGTAVQTELDLDPALPSVFADPGQLRQVVSNLVINANEAMEGAGRIIARARRAEPSEVPPPLDATAAWVQVELQDTGPGIPFEVSARAFDPYVSSKERGSGIGLTVCWMLITRLGGHIELESPPGQGTTARIFLPVADEPPFDETLFNSAPEASIAKVLGLRVAWMDDDEMVRSVARRMGARLQWELSLFTEGGELLDAVDSTERWPELFVLDLTIRGGLGGVETLRRLRARRPDCAIILVSGYSAEFGQLTREEVASIHRVIKPFRLEDLVEAAVCILYGDPRRAETKRGLPASSPDGTTRG